MRYFVSKQIHCGAASCQSGDVFLHREILKNDKPADVKETVVDKKLGYTLYYVKEDETFYRKALAAKKFFDTFAETPEFKALVIKYESEGWIQNIPWLKDAQKAHWDAESAATLNRRIKEGYVIPEWSDKLQVKDYQGGFSDAVFNQKELQNYLKDGGCHGYIGHSVRKKNIDAYIEMRFIATCRPICILEHIEPESILAVWLMSTDGRHFGNSLEGKSFAEQKIIVGRNVVSMYNNAYLYSLPEHEGTAKSIEDDLCPGPALRDLRIKHAGKLLPE